ncbi:MULTISPECIES: hypothetical protein [Oscillatoriales]|uniref:hypothetical protein n=2 Tax=Limnospira platensis TaxID=118562 RepID=UPI0001D0EC5E|nr:hypothetical protein AP9108_27745 [Arthrospira sp. PCC 9108]BAI93518.1 hypothetical protein NIES39_O02690 [Arthrospira platensis NIES-39]
MMLGFTLVSPNLPRAIAYLSRLGGGTEPNTTISPLYWVSPSFHPTYKCWVKPKQQRATKSDRLFK